MNVRAQLIGDGDGRAVEFSVADEGIGISPSELDLPSKTSRRSMAPPLAASAASASVCPSCSGWSRPTTAPSTPPRSPGGARPSSSDPHRRALCRRDGQRAAADVNVLNRTVVAPLSSAIIALMLAGIVVVGVDRSAITSSPARPAWSPTGSSRWRSTACPFVRPRAARSWVLTTGSGS